MKGAETRFQLDFRTATWGLMIANGFRNPCSESRVDLGFIGITQIEIKSAPADLWNTSTEYD